MPDRETEQQGPSARLPRALIWAGVGLAPVAAIVVLLGGSVGSARFAVLLIAVCVVLIGASMLIRSDPVLLRMDVEDRVAQEVDTLREQLRAEIAAAARATHHRVQALQDELGQVRAMATAPPPVAAPAVGNGPSAGSAGNGRMAAPMGSARAAAPIGNGRPVVPIGNAQSSPSMGNAQSAAPMGNGRPAAPMGNGRPAVPTGNGRSGAPVGTGWPEPMRSEPAGPTGGRAVVPAASMSPSTRPPGIQPGNGSGPIPHQHAAAAVRPPMAPVFRPPMGPRSGPPSSGPPLPGPGPGNGPVRRPAGPPGGAYGTPRRPEPEPPYGSGPGHDDGLSYGNGSSYDEGQSYGNGPGHDDGLSYGSSYIEGQSYGNGPGHDDGLSYGNGSSYNEGQSYDSGPSYDDGQSCDSAPGYDKQPYDRGSAYDGGPGHDVVGNRAEPAARDDGQASGGPERSGKRRADVTAVDLGYTGRRSRPNHATADADDGPDENPGYTGYGAPSPDLYGPDPMDEQYDWRQPGERW